VLARGVFAAASYLIHVTLSSLLFILVVRWQDLRSMAQSERAGNPLQRQLGGFGVTMSGGFMGTCGGISS
jgi:hypothetical protein